jgi:hypothetical protein
MKIPPVDLGFLVDRGTDLCERVADAWDDRAPRTAGSRNPDLVAAGLDQLFTVVHHLERPSPDAPAPLTPAELRELVGYGIGLFAELAACAREAGMEQAAGSAEALSLPFAVLLARHGAEIAVLEPVVNALAALANGLSDPAELARLYGLMGEIVNAVSPAVAQDPDRSAPERPWRVLLLNRAIVATRSHRPALMEPAFDAVVEHLPEDAARFFEEGMAQMDALDYPPQVRAVMERYYLRQGPAPHTLH